MSLPTNMLLSNSLPSYITKEVINMLETVHPTLGQKLWMVWARYLYCRGAITSPNFTELDQFLVENKEDLIKMTYFLENNLKEQTARITELRTLFSNLIRMPQPSSV